MTAYRAQSDGHGRFDFVMAEDDGRLSVIESGIKTPERANARAKAWTEREAAARRKAERQP